MIPIRDTIPSRNPALMVWMLVLLNALFFVFELMIPESRLERIFYLFGIVPARYTHPEWATWIGFPLDDYWPFLTSMFLHGGWMHIIGNMWTLWIFGDNVEDRMGPGRFLVFYLVCGIVAGVIHLLANADSTIPTIGASGAIAGVMGAYLVMFTHARIIAMVPIFFVYPLFFEIPAVLYLGFWYVSQVFSGSFSLASPTAAGGVAWWAHVGGFVAGMILHPLFVQGRRRYRAFAEDEWGLEGAWSPYRFR